MRRAATLALLGATAVWGATFVTVKDALAASDSFTFLALRFALGAVTAGALAGRALASREVWRRGLVLGVFLFGGYLAQTVGLETTSPARSAFLTGLTVVFVPFVSWALSRRRPAVAAFVAPLFAVAGLQWLTGFGVDGAPLLRGDALTLACAGLYAVHIALTSWLTEGAGPLPHAAEPGPAPGAKGAAPALRYALAVTAVQLLVTSAAAAACLPFVEVRFAPTPAYWGAVLFTGVVASAVAIGVQVWAQRLVTAVRAAVIFALEPVIALAWAAAMGAGWPTGHEWVGGSLVLGAVLVSEVGAALRPAPQAPAPAERGAGG